MRRRLVSTRFDAMPDIERILTVENTADLPVQQPTKFQFAINLKTTKALELNVLPPLLATASE